MKIGSPLCVPSLYARQYFQKRNKNTAADDLPSSIIQHQCVDTVIIISNFSGRLHGEWVAVIAAIINARFITILKYSCAAECFTTESPAYGVTDQSNKTRRGEEKQHDSKRSGSATTRQTYERVAVDAESRGADFTSSPSVVGTRRCLSSWSVCGCAWRKDNYWEIKQNFQSLLLLFQGRYISSVFFLITLPFYFFFNRATWHLNQLGKRKTFRKWQEYVYKKKQHLVL